MDLDGIARRVAYWRNRRGLSQTEMGERMSPPRSRAWVDKFERGERQSDPRISVLEQISVVLDVPLERLLSGDAHHSAAECVDEVEAGAIRDALLRYDVVSGRFGVPGGPDPAAVDLVARETRYGWDAFQAAHYAALGRLLPQLIVNTQRTAAADGGAPAWTIASFAYQLTSAVLVKFGDGTSAWHAADRGVLAAERSGEPNAIASAARRSAEALSALGHSAQAMEMCLRAADRLESELLRAGDDGVSMLGMLYLKAAVCAAHAAEKTQSAALIARAGEYATMLGRDGNALWSGFGPTNAQIHQVATLMQLDEGGAALRAAALIDPAALRALPRERQVHHLADLAIAQIQTGRLDEALSTLLAAERLGAQEVHCRPRTRATIARLAEATSAPSARLRALAERSGVTP